MLANNCTSDEINSSLAELEQQGFVERADGSAHGFRTTPAGRRASEMVWRERKRRRKPLLDQLSFPLADLIIALAYEPWAHNRRLPGGVWGTVSTFPLVDVVFYLCDWPEQAIRAACVDLETAGLLKNITPTTQEQREYVELTPKGVRHYTRAIRKRLGLAEDQCLLDPAPGTLQVFFAWQSEFKPSRNILSEIVPKVIAQLNATGSLIQTLTLVEATEPGEGALRIDVALQEKIRSADYFVGDLTPVYAYKHRLRVNENVLIETGFALASKPQDRVVLLALSNPSVDGDGSANPQRAFDIGHIRRIEFRDKQEAQRKLLTELQSMLARDGWMLD